ncbi:collagenase [Streptomyces sp. WMMC500]|uniref:collagenase n=1 Tax=Streptomyces sp. WMMC500 TaxID=3015154 RepID=UPI00248C8EC3|nr:collagenase [Streptomyces sp. WMMC500]WBB64584.1 collagenase [Streptomyces sp. WMMC500]
MCLGAAYALVVPAGATAAPDRAPAPVSALAPSPATPDAIAAGLAPADPATTAEPKAEATLLPPVAATADAAARKLARTAAGPGEAACNVADFTSKTGAALVDQIKASETACVNTLFGVTGADARALFQESQMVTVANAYRDTASSYQGDNSASITQIVLYLRAGYYVQYGDPDGVGEYGPALKSAVQGGLDAFFASPRAYDVTEANGETLSESVVLIDSAVENARYLDVVKKLLTGYDSSYDEFWWMVNAVNSTYTVIFRGNWVPEFIDAVAADQSLLALLRDFAVKHKDLVGTDKQFLATNAGRELGRFLQHDQLREAVRPLARELLDATSLDDPATAALWVGVAEMTDAFDKENCDFFGTCNLQERVRQAVLPVTHTCADSLEIVAQKLTDEQLAQSCTSMLGQDEFFHGVAKDSGPVADDHNTKLEVVAFDSSLDYRTYAGVVFGIDTNNGGMYLEGDPAQEGNLPRFIAYRAEWADEFEIWNLNHEYTHYLDGRFNMYGDFAENMKTPTVMWIEGFAEYVSYAYRDLPNEDAIAEAGNNTYALSTLFGTTYENADSTRIYQWGYLAVRYLLQSHPEDVAALLGHYRTGDWEAARTLLTGTIGNRYDADFAAWLSRCAAGDCGTAAAR